MTALNAPSIAASGWWRSTSEGCTRTSTAPSDERRRADEADDHAHLVGGADVARHDRLDALVGDVVERDPRPERDRREDRHLRGRVRAGDVLGRVGLGEPEPLRLGERVLVGLAPLHLREDVVGRPVDDPEHAMDVRDDERLAKHLDHRDGGADGRLEAQLDARRRGGGEELGAALRDQLLVRRDDRLAGREQLEHVRRGRARSRP